MRTPQLLAALGAGLRGCPVEHELAGPGLQLAGPTYCQQLRCLQSSREHPPSYPEWESLRSGLLEGDREAENQEGVFVPDVHMARSSC